MGVLVIGSCSIGLMPPPRMRNGQSLPAEQLTQVERLRRKLRRWPFPERSSLFSPTSSTTKPSWQLPACTESRVPTLVSRKPSMTRRLVTCPRRHQEDACPTWSSHQRNSQLLFASLKRSDC